LASRRESGSHADRIWIVRRMKRAAADIADAILGRGSREHVECANAAASC
jgi:hypothetical protein